MPLNSVLPAAGHMLLAAAIFLLAGCGSSGGAPEAAKGGGKSGRAFQVRTAPVTTAEVTYVIESTGNIEALNVYRIDARVAGTIQDVNFKEGDEASATTVLCRIAPLSYELTALKNEALVKKAQADLADMQRRVRNEIELSKVRLQQAELEVERRRVVRAAGAIAEEEVQIYQSRRDLAAIELKDIQEAAGTQLAVMEATVREKEADWKIAVDNVRKSSVTSPITGVIESKLVTNGMYVTAGQSLAEVVDRSALRLKFNLPESKAPYVRVGSLVEFKVEAYPDRVFKATVYRVGDLTDTNSRQVTCWAKVEPSEAALKAGFFATVQLKSEAKKSAVVVPVTATLPTERGFVAYVIEDDKARARKLKLGLHVTGDQVEVLEGLKSGEILVVEGASALQDGVAVADLGKARQGKPAEKSGQPQVPEKKL